MSFIISLYKVLFMFICSMFDSVIFVVLLIMTQLNNYVVHLLCSEMNQVNYYTTLKTLRLSGQDKNLNRHFLILT